jgi:hypothetical protein
MLSQLFSKLFAKEQPMPDAVTPADIAANNDAATVAELVLFDHVLRLHGTSMIGLLTKLAQDQAGIIVTLPKPATEVVEG